MYEGFFKTRKMTANYKHGHRTGNDKKRSPTYYSWQGMISRCKRPSHMCYDNYGGRGITICDRWKEFKNFLEDMGVRPKGKTLDRIEVNGNYEPSNCKWSTRKQQQNNRREDYEKK